jgi:diacylglycerol kinase (ATP)
VSSVFGPMRLIAPGAPRGAAGRVLADLTARLRDRDLDFDVVHPRAREAGEAARAALEAGRRYLVAVGGDDTVNAVVNGLFDDGEAIDPDVVFAVAGTQAHSDFARTYGLDRAPSLLANHLASDKAMDIDVGQVTFTTPDGESGSRLFVNLAQAGYGADLIRRRRRLLRFTGRVGRLLAAYGAIRGARRPETAVALAHTTATDPLLDLVVANGQFFGNGMKVAPRALPDDGKFNVQIYTGGRSQMFLLTQRLYRGEHLPDPQIREYQSPTVSVAPEPCLPVEADGTFIGWTPASFTILERVLRLKI